MTCRRVMLKEVRVIWVSKKSDSAGNVLAPDTTNGPYLEVIQETPQAGGKYGCRVYCDRRERSCTDCNVSVLRLKA